MTRIHLDWLVDLGRWLLLQNFACKFLLAVQCLLTRYFLFIGNDVLSLWKGLEKRTVPIPVVLPHHVLLYLGSCSFFLSHLGFFCVFLSIKLRLIGNLRVFLWRNFKLLLKLSRGRFYRTVGFFSLGRLRLFSLSFLKWFLVLTLFLAFSFYLFEFGCLFQDDVFKFFLAPNHLLPLFFYHFQLPTPSLLHTAKFFSISCLKVNFLLGRVLLFFKL